MDNFLSAKLAALGNPRVLLIAASAAVSMVLLGVHGQAHAAEWACEACGGLR